MEIAKKISNKVKKKYFSFKNNSTLLNLLRNFIKIKSKKLKYEHADI
jgi:hypothetical protein